MFEALGFTKERAHEQFGFLLDAFKYGVPPHAGLAYGLDRLCMLMAKVDTIRDVIAFPKVKDASCLMTEAPTRVAPKQLEEFLGHNRVSTTMEIYVKAFDDDRKAVAGFMNSILEKSPSCSENCSD